MVWEHRAMPYISSITDHPYFSRVMMHWIYSSNPGLVWGFFHEFLNIESIAENQNFSSRMTELNRGALTRP
jgi:hypothetical protein